MLATFIIGLREGLEAALIVGIIAAFLRNNGKSLAPMWWGVGLAVLLSIAVGATLDLLERALPQAAQEGMESIIGLIAVVFVTGMISWMNTHARNLKREIEAETAEALGQASSFALASMAFLAVLKEGFETSVFLLATFSAAQSAELAVLGATAGLLAAVVIGWGIFIGGVKINLGQFFRLTGAFLILVAAGLVVTSLRTAHEAGWLNAGQQLTWNLSWLVAPGTVRSALITGVLGIPADPRLIEVIGWLAYLVPVSLSVYWPSSHRPRGPQAAKLQLAGAFGLAALALGLAMAWPRPVLEAPHEADVVAETDTASLPLGSARLATDPATGSRTLTVAIKGMAPVSLVVPDAPAETALHNGLPAASFDLTGTRAPQDAPKTLTLDDVARIGGGRIPVGVDPGRSPGPFVAEWSIHDAVNLWISQGVLIDGAGSSVTIVKMSGGGLQTPRILRVDADAEGPAPAWRIAPAYRDRAVAALQRFETTRAERHFWAVEIPVLLFSACLFSLLVGARTLVASRRTKTGKDRRSTDTPAIKGAPHVAK